MKRALVSVLALTTVVGASTQALAWGSTGHRWIGRALHYSL